MLKNFKLKALCAFPVVVLAIGTATGCGNDAATERRDTGAAKAKINMPDNFPTVAHKCYGQNGVYVTNSAEASPGGLAVIVKDPECAS